MLRRAGGQAALTAKPLQKHQLRAPPSPFPSLALCVLLAGRPPRAPRLLPSPPPRGCGGEGLHPAGAGLGPLHGMGEKASLWLEARDSVSGWV